MYRKTNNTHTYKLPKDHFFVLFNIVAKNGGAVVKTIDDAIMASFSTDHNALATAFEAGVAFADGTNNIEKLVDIKIGVHSDPCIAVTLNDSMDYCRTTVNVASSL